jgi:hypothetical protein
MLVGQWAAPAHERAACPEDETPRAARISTSAELFAALENARARWAADLR